jgi:hypothetical protein
MRGTTARLAPVQDGDAEAALSRPPRDGEPNHAGTDNDEIR